jgi:H+/Cl- antiporter ClcA
MLSSFVNTSLYTSQVWDLKLGSEEYYNALELGIFVVMGAVAGLLGCAIIKLHKRMYYMMKSTSVGKNACLLIPNKSKKWYLRVIEK